MEGGAADLADGPGPSHACLAKCDQRLRGGSPHIPRNQDDPSSRRCPDRHRPEDGPEALETVRGVLGRHPLDARLVGRHACGGLPPSDRREVADAEAQHQTRREWLHGNRLDQSNHNPRRDRLPPDLRIHQRESPLFHRRQVRTLPDDRDQGAPAEARDGRVRATGEHRRAGDETRGAGGHPPRPDRTRPRGTDLEAGADFMKSGIVSYGGYIPRYRIRPKDIGTVWGADGEAMGRGLNIRAKSVPGPDEDVITISVEAARACMAKVDIDPTEIGAIYVGSESHPYAVKPTATIVAEAIGSAPVMTARDNDTRVTGVDSPANRRISSMSARARNCSSSARGRLRRTMITPSSISRTGNFRCGPRSNSGSRKPRSTPACASGRSETRTAGRSWWASARSSTKPRPETVSSPSGTAAVLAPTGSI